MDYDDLDDNPDGEGWDYHIYPYGAQRWLAPSEGDDGQPPAKVRRLHLYHPDRIHPVRLESFVEQELDSGEGTPEYQAWLEARRNKEAEAA